MEKKISQLAKASNWLMNVLDPNAGKKVEQPKKIEKVAKVLTGDKK